MSSIIACPFCGRKLRVSDELRGQMVRCPACNETFDSARAPEPSPPAATKEPPLVPQDLPLQLTIDEPSDPKPAAGATPGLVGAVELKLSLDEDESPPRTPEAPPAEPSPPPEPWGSPRRKPPRLANEHDEDVPSIRRRGPRRDCEPHRGTTVLTVGIISLVCLTISCVPVGAILGLVAWVMGQRDLRKIKKGDMDPTGQRTTQAGWICGILGTVLNGLVTLGCGAFLAILFIAEHNRPVNRPVRPVPTQNWKVPPQPNKPNPPFQRRR
jgi:hypothetical protein